MAAYTRIGQMRTHSACQASARRKESGPSGYGARRRRTASIPLRPSTGRVVHVEVPAVIAVVAALFFIWGVAAERIATVWPAVNASRRRPGVRSAVIGLAAAAAAAGVAWRSELPVWATAGYLAFIALLVVLTATDLEQHLLPHAVLDPLILGAIAFVPFNPAVSWQSAVLGGVAGVAFLGVLGRAVRGGIALGDLYLAAPLGLLLGVSGAFTALLVAALLAGGVSAGLLLARRVGLKTYIPFGPFLVAGAVVALLTGPELTGA